MNERKIPVGVLGATGTVGQRFVTLLADHPWFEIVALTASDRSAGRPYREAAEWVQAAPIPAGIGEMEVLPTRPPLEPRLVFSALDASAAGPVEAELADRGHLVVSNARSHRMDPDVPLLVPEVNPDHLELLRGPEGDGGIITNPNCSTIGLVLALRPLVDAFGVDRVHVVTLQAISGAGLPGVPGLRIVDNVVPHIPGEEEKLEAEPGKILGTLSRGGIDPAALTVSAACNRVPVLDGHTECVSVSLGRPASPGEMKEAWADFSGEPQALGLPSAPHPVIHYLEGPNDPQPRLTRDLGGGMAIAVGRLRPCPILDYRFVTISHNTIRGAAGGAILCAELAVARGMKGFSAPTSQRLPEAAVTPR